MKCERVERSQSNLFRKDVISLAIAVSLPAIVLNDLRIFLIVFFEGYNSLRNSVVPLAVITDFEFAGACLRWASLG
jgi:hypothetical protein